MGISVAEFTDILKTNNLYNGSLSQFCKINGWHRTSVSLWRKSGIPPRAITLLKKELELLQLYNESCSTYDHFVSVLDRYNLYSGSISNFIAENGWQRHRKSVWRRKGNVPNLAWNIIKKDLIINNLKSN